MITSITTQMFFYEFCKIFTKTYFVEHLRTNASEYLPIRADFRDSGQFYVENFYYPAAYH